MRKLNESVKQLVIATESIKKAQSELAGIIDTILTREQLNQLQLAIDHLTEKVVKIEVMHSNFRGVRNAIDNQIIWNKK